MRRERKQPANLTRPGDILPWPRTAPSLEEVASGLRYFGSAQHKRYPTSYPGAPALRAASTGQKDAVECEYWPEERWPDIEAALRRAVLAGCVGVEESGFPRKVWGYFEGKLYEARQINPGYGQYKGYQAVIPPLDRHARLEVLRRELGIQD